MINWLLSMEDIWIVWNHNSQGAYEIETIIAMLNVSDTLFELVYSGYNAFESLSTFLYHWFHKYSQLQSILGFDSSIIEKEVDNPKW